MRHVGPVERLDDPPLAQDSLVAVCGRARRRNPDDAAFVAAANVVDLVLGAAREEAVIDRLALAGQALVVHPCGKPVEIHHRFPTSCSKYSVNSYRRWDRSPGLQEES